MLCLRGFVCRRNKVFRIEHLLVDAQNMVHQPTDDQINSKSSKTVQKRHSKHANAGCVRHGKVGFIAVFACVKVKCHVYHRGS